MSAEPKAELGKLRTEQVDEKFHLLDIMSIGELLKAMNESDGDVPRAIALQLPSIERAIDAIVDRLKAKDMGIELTQGAKDLLAARGYDPLLGARPLRRVIQREIEDALSERILFSELKPGEIIVVDVDGDGPDATFTFTGAPKATMPDSPEDLAEAPTA